MARLVLVASTRIGSTGASLALQARVRGHDVINAGSPPGPRRLAGADAVVLVPLRGDPRRHVEQAASAVVAAAGEAAPGAHLLLVSSFAVGHGPGRGLNRLTPSPLPARRAAERAFAAAGQPFTIIRPTWLTDDPPGRYRITITDDPYADGMIARGDVACVVLEAIEQPAARGLTVTVFAEPGRPAASLGPAFVALARSRR